MLATGFLAERKTFSALSSAIKVYEPLDDMFHSLLIFYNHFFPDLHHRQVR